MLAPENTASSSHSSLKLGNGKKDINKKIFFIMKERKIISFKMGFYRREKVFFPTAGPQGMKGFPK
jgi:hypothetical protein